MKFPLLSTYVIILFVLTACCQKKDCECCPETICVSLNGFTDQEKEAFEVNVFDLNNRFIENKSLKPANACACSYGIIMGARPEDVYYVIRNSITGSVDTLSNFSKTTSIVTEKCNNCFPTPSKLTCEVFENVSFDYKGNRVSGKSITISK